MKNIVKVVIIIGFIGWLWYGLSTPPETGHAFKINQSQKI